MCDSCEVVRINGVLCHEAGCPEAYKDEVRGCKWCSQKFKPIQPHQTCCSHTCTVAYYNLPCGCEECNPPQEDDNE